MNLLTLILALAQASSPALAAAVQPAATPPVPYESPYDRIWKFTELYSDATNPAVQRVLLSGRFHYDLAALHADQGDHREANVRRFRIGPRVTLFHKLTLHSEVELDLEQHDPVYARFTDFNVQWIHNGRLSLTVGKQSAPFTMDGATSSRELLTIDRSNLANNIWFPQEYLPGVSVSGRSAPWTYRVGVYSAGEANREFGEFNGGVATLGLLGYDFARSLGAKEAVLSGSYVHQHPDRANTFTRQLAHIGSINFRLEAGRWGARTEVSAASGYLGQSDLWAFVAMPFFNVTDQVQVVGRYTVIDSEDVNGIRPAAYESRLVPGRGNRYNEFYAGANYYFYGHRLKLQSGVQFADMQDRAGDGGAYSGVSWTTGLRVGW
jgi:phosphate-selective porin OprO and OprP